MEKSEWTELVLMSLVVNINESFCRVPNQPSYLPSLCFCRQKCLFASDFIRKLI